MVGLSCRQTGSFSSGQIQAVADEFHEDGGFGGTGEKFREGMAEGNGHNLFGRCQSRANGSDPRAEGLPDQRGFRRGENLQQALGDEPKLDVAMVGRDLATDAVAVGLRLVVLALATLMPSPTRTGLPLTRRMPGSSRKTRAHQAPVSLSRSRAELWKKSRRRS